MNTHFFITYIQPLTVWLHDHATIALILAFLISFAESLAVIGSIVPGSVVMTMVGILAGSGVMRIDLTLIAATLGAIAGDGGSYMLGYVFSDRLLLMWPFKHHPKWLQYGYDFFERHGGKSIFLGRFVGPLRSIIPVIAGMMRMRHMEFLVSNCISAVAWSIVYVGPGILIGTASAELSPESATRLFLFIIGALVIAWITSVCFKWMWNRLRPLFNAKLHHAWCRINTIPPLNRISTQLTPAHESNHAATAALILLTGLCLLVSIGLIIWVSGNHFLKTPDAPLFFFLQSLRTQSFDVFFILLTLLMSAIPLMVLITSLAVWAGFQRDWRTMYYWLSLSLTCTLITFSLNMSMTLPILANELFQNQPNSRFPASDLTLATACFSFLLLSLSHHSHTNLRRVLRIVLISLLLFSGVALLYLGDYWSSGVLGAYSIGLCLGLAHWVLYRRHTLPTTTLRGVFLALSLFLCAGVGSGYVAFTSTLREHSPIPQQYMLNHHAWWTQQEPLLPRYTTTRLGRPIGLLNVQYLGKISTLIAALEAQGWHEQSTSLLQTFLLRTGATKQSASNLPLKIPFYLSQKPTLTFIYSASPGKPSLVLNLWRSNYHIISHPQPLWVGSLQPYVALKTGRTGQSHAVVKSFQPLLSALHAFETHTQALSSDTSQQLLMIKAGLHNQ